MSEGEPGSDSHTSDGSEKGNQSEVNGTADTEKPTNLNEATNTIATNLIYPQETEEAQNSNSNQDDNSHNSEKADESSSDEEAKADITENENNENNEEEESNNENDENENDGGIAKEVFQNEPGELEPRLPPIPNLVTYQEDSSIPPSPPPPRKSTNESKSPQNSSRLRKSTNPPLQNDFPIVRPQKPRDLSSSARPTFQRLPQPTEPTPEMQKLMDRAIAGENLSSLTEDVYDELIVNLQQLRKRMASQHKYKDGNKINDAIKRVESYRTELQKAQYKKVAVEEYQETLEAFQAQKDEFDRITKEKVKELEDQQKKKREELQETHQQQLLDHQQHWTSPNKSRLYNRASTQLTILRRQHAFLLVQCRFDEAEVINREIQAKTAVEEVENHKLYQHAYEESLALLQQKQKDETEFLENRLAVEIASLVQRRARERRVLENKEKKIASKADVVNDPDKLWNLMQLQRIEELTSQSRSLQPSSKMTRRDIQDRDVAILSLPPLNLKTSAMPSSTRKSRR